MTYDLLHDALTTLTCDWEHGGVVVKSVPRGHRIVHDRGAFELGPNTYPVFVTWPSYPVLPWSIRDMVHTQRWFMLLDKKALANAINPDVLVDLIRVLVSAVRISTSETD